MTPELTNALRTLTSKRVRLAYDTHQPLQHANGKTIITVESGVLQCVFSSYVTIRLQEKTIGSAIAYIAIDDIKAFSDLSMEGGDAEEATIELMAQRASVGDIIVKGDK